VLQTSEVLNMLVVSPGVPVSTVKEFIDYVRRNPGKVTYGSSGIGSPDHLAGELFDRVVGVKTIHVPYKGGGPAAMLDLMAGNLQFMFATVASAQGQWKAGKVRGLALVSAQRQPLFPDLPAMAESLPGYAVNNWYGLFMPARTPQPVVGRLNAEFNKLLRLPEVIERQAVGGIVPVGGTQEAFVAFIKAEAARWAKIIRDAGIRLE
jgi:tripartite-type tricarboxylate transporter receptor subunit TctC